MTRLRLRCAPIVALALTSTICADEKSKSDGSHWAVDRTLTVSPSGVQTQAFRHRLLPLHSELKEGNAAPIYLRLAHETTDAAKRSLTETPKPWNSGALEKTPLKEAREFLERNRYMLRQFELGARRKSCDWCYTIDAGDPISILLPDAQAMRGYVPMLVLQVRTALAEGDFDAAARHLQTGFGFSQHVNEAPFLITGLVGVAIASQFAGAVGDYIERPDSPNLYWPLAALPRPFIDLRRGTDFEYRILEMTFPELEDLDRARSTEEWDRILRAIRTKMRFFATIPEEGKSSGLPPWYSKHFAPEEPASKSPHLAAAREHLARTRRLSAERIAAMPASQAILLHFVDVYHEDRDSIYRAACLPYPQGFKLYADAMAPLREPPTSEGRAMSKLILSAIDRALSSQARLERTLAALRVVEALRIHAAAHEGRLPDKLSGVSEVFVPDDPGTGKPFEYVRDGEAATISSRIPGDPIANNGVRFRVTIRKP